MAFICTFQLNNGAIKPSDEIFFVEYIDKHFGNFHSMPVKIAKILFNKKPAYVYSNCPCFPSSKGTLQSGDKINSETKIAYFSAEGEDIPYDRPYATVEFEEN